MPVLFDERGMNRRKLSGPPVGQTTNTTTPHGQRVDPKGAAPGQGPTPDATIRQRVLNGQADTRRNMRERSLAGPPETEQPSTPSALGTPAEATAPPRQPA